MTDHRTTDPHPTAPAAADPARSAATVADTEPLRRAEALSSTYRVQLRTPESDPDGRGFTFADVEEILPYLADLGVGSVYLSPVLSAVRGSTHGYDVVDPTRVEESLGGIDGLRALRAACREQGLGLVVDIVPNHVGVEDPRQNAWWWNVLRNGRESEYARYFDVDWSVDNGADGRIALPVFGSPGDVDALEVDESGDEPILRLFEHAFPVAPGTLGGDGREVHERQHYRLVHWREPLLGYRRFFTVTGLAGLRQEDQEVFDATHAEVRRWCAEDLVDGIRVDHPDGLADPVGYARRLRALAGDDRWLLMEKILAPGEVLDPAMPVDGTTGYDMLRLIDQVLVDRRGEERLSALAERYCGGSGDEAEVHRRSGELKREVLTGDLAPEIARLARSVRRDAAAGLTATDDGVDDASLAQALVRVVELTPYYRADYPVLRGALPGILETLHHDRPALAPALRLIGGALARGGESSVRLAQVTGAATAKAEEDRLFYRLGRLVSLNEVGGSPGRMGIPVEAFHLTMAEKAVSSPLTLTALTTHDTKRGEDVRARVSVLSQIPDDWADFVCEVFSACPPPTEDAGYFLLQVVVGVWPSVDGPSATLRSRLHAYAEKSMREAAVHTTWTDPDEAFETAVRDWIDALIDTRSRLVGRFVDRIAGPGFDNALVAKAVQLLAPGVPDVYQGTEVWEDALVDPDNRRFVDYGPLRSGAVAAAGHPKFELVRTALRLRRDHPEAMARGAHVPLPLVGPGAADVLAFTRDVDGRAAVGMIARRRTAVVSPDDLGGTRVELPEGPWVVHPGSATLSGSVDVGALLGEVPVVVLTRGGD